MAHGEGAAGDGLPLTEGLTPGEGLPAGLASGVALAGALVAGAAVAGAALGAGDGDDVAGAGHGDGAAGDGDDAAGATGLGGAPEAPVEGAAWATRMAKRTEKTVTDERLPSCRRNVRVLARRE